MTDEIIVLDAYGSYPGRPNWDPHADIDENGRIDMTDLMLVLDHFGQTWQKSWQQLG
jgi:hypothetical protein